MFQAGDRVMLNTINKELRTDGLRKWQTGTVRELEGKLGVEFDGYSDTGYNAGLQVIKFNTRADDGTVVPILTLCTSEIRCINCKAVYKPGTGQFTVFGNWFCNHCLD